MFVRVLDHIYIAAPEPAPAPAQSLADIKRQAKLKQGAAAGESKGGVAFEVDMTPPPPKPGEDCHFP